MWSGYFNNDEGQFNSSSEMFNFSARYKIGESIDNAFTGSGVINPNGIDKLCKHGDVISDSEFQTLKSSTASSGSGDMFSNFGQVSYGTLLKSDFSLSSNKISCFLGLGTTIGGLVDPFRDYNGCYFIGIRDATGDYIAIQSAKDDRAGILLAIDSKKCY